MSLIIFLGLLHLGFLTGSSFLAVRAMFTSHAAKICATAILVYSNIVACSLGLSCFNQLGNNVAYSAVSLGLSLVVFGLLRRGSPSDSAPAAAEPSPDTPKHRWARGTLWSLLLLFGSASLAITFTHSTSNGDSLSYRFSRAIFYVSHGNLLHFGEIGDPRYLFYPFNGTLLYVFCARYHFGDLGLRLVSFFAWSLTGIGIYATGRSLLASRTAALAAACCGLLAPSVLAQATSTNDEILLAAAALCTLPILIAWGRTPSVRLALLAGAGAGVTLGTKLHWYFYWPLVFIVGVAAAVYLWRHPVWTRTFLLRHLPSVAGFAILVLGLSLPFIAANWISAHKITNSYFNNLVLNKPFRWPLAVEKIQVNSGQLFLSSIPDLVPSAPGTDRLPLYKGFNDFTSRWLFPHITECRKIGPEGFQFQGAAAVTAERMTEYSVGFGALPWLILSLLLLNLGKNRLFTVSTLLLISFFAWHLSYSAQMKYIDGYLPYYTFAATIACAGMGGALSTLPNWSIRPVYAAFGLGLAAQCVLDTNLLLLNENRNLRYIATKSGALDQQIIDPAVKKFVRSRNEFQLHYQFWGQAFWPIMHQNPAATYRVGTSEKFASIGATHLFYAAIAVGNTVKVPVVVPSTITGGATHLGYAVGGQLFAAGGPPIQDTAAQRFAVFDASVTRAENGSWKSVHIAGPWVGPDASAQLEFRFSLVASAQAPDPFTPWFSAGAVASIASPPQNEAGNVIVVEVRSRLNPKIIVRTEVSTRSATPGIPAYAVEYQALEQTSRPVGGTP